MSVVNVPLPVTISRAPVNDQWRLESFCVFGGPGLFPTTGDLGLARCHQEHVICCLIHRDRERQYFVTIGLDYSLGTIDETFVNLVVTLRPNPGSDDIDIDRDQLQSTVFQLLKTYPDSYMGSFWPYFEKTRRDPDDMLMPGSYSSYHYHSGDLAFDN